MGPLTGGLVQFVSPQQPAQQPATSLLDQPGMENMPGPGPEPPLGDLLEIAMEIPEVSRLPLCDD